MRYTSSILCAAALAGFVVADDAPVVQGNAQDLTYSATIPQKNADDLSGAVKIAASPDGEGVNIQIALYNLPAGGPYNYGLYTGAVASLDDCSASGSYFNPYGGITGDKCKSDKASCAIGDLSDKYGEAEVLSGGSGTGFFTANYADKYLSTQKGDEAYFAGGSFVMTDASGGYIACANFIDASKVNKSKASKSAAKGATATPSSASAAATEGTSTQEDLAIRTAAPVMAAGIVGLAALLL